MPKIFEYTSDLYFIFSPMSMSPFMCMCCMETKKAYSN